MRVLLVVRGWPGSYPRTSNARAPSRNGAGYDGFVSDVSAQALAGLVTETWSVKCDMFISSPSVNFRGEKTHSRHQKSIR
jgi:hypothetical protein